MTVIAKVLMSISFVSDVAQFQGKFHFHLEKGFWNPFKAFKNSYVNHQWCIRPMRTEDSGNMNLDNSFNVLWLSLLIYKMGTIILCINKRVDAESERQWVWRKERWETWRCHSQRRVGLFGLSRKLHPVSYSHSKSLFTCTPWFFLYNSCNDQKILLSCLGILAGWLNAQSTHLNQHKSATWRRGNRKGLLSLHWSHSHPSTCPHKY